MTAAIVDFVPMGLSLKCFAPARVRAGRDATGGITVACDPRSRLGGGLRLTLQAEAVEQYRFIFYADGTFSTAVITDTNTVPFYFLSAAAQTAAFSGLLAPCFVGIAQLGALEYGYEARAAV